MMRSMVAARVLSASMTVSMLQAGGRAAGTTRAVGSRRPRLRWVWSRAWPGSEGRKRPGSSSGCARDVRRAAAGASVRSGRRTGCLRGRRDTRHRARSIGVPGVLRDVVSGLLVGGLMLVPGGCGSVASCCTRLQRARSHACEPFLWCCRQALGTGPSSMKRPVPSRLLISGFGTSASARTGQRVRPSRTRVAPPCTCSGAS